MIEDDGGERIVRRKLSDQVLERLRAMIERGEIGPGEHLPSERDLMQRFGVGRPAVREAMQSLGAMGLITIAQGGRAKVGPLSLASALQHLDPVAQLLLSVSADNLEHLKQARRLFELSMVRIAVGNAGAVGAAKLAALAAAQRACLGDPPAFMRADMAFHTEIARLTGNPLFAALSDAMLGWLFAYHSDLLIRSGQEEVTLAEHDEIVQRIADGDADGAAEAMRVHLDRSAELYRHHGVNAASNQ